MCAINGFNWKNEDLISRMNEVTKHRGPDGTNVFLGDKLSLGHNRLSIIDLSHSADQPMKSADAKLVIVFNGEIYNFKELKEELSSEYRFETQSDTEVILASYQKWGRDCVNKFNGIFAFAIWDQTKKELFVARDHVGVKPFYYYHKNNKFIFSSEIKGILEHNIPRKLNREAFNHYLNVLYVPAPLTMLDNIWKLPPAHYGVYKSGTFETTKYWSSSEQEEKISKEEAKQGVFDHLHKAVERQLVSDRPVGVYLSGGFDSSIILDRMSAFHDNIETFSVNFDLLSPKAQKRFNVDSVLAEKTANFYNTYHNKITLHPHEIPELIKSAVWHMDEPIASPTAVAMYKIAEFAKQKVDVVLAGNGGDELFGGYERYRLSLVASDIQKILPSSFLELFSWNDKLAKLNTREDIARFALFMFQKDFVLEKIMKGNLLNRKSTENFFKEKYFTSGGNSSFTERFMKTDFNSWLVDQSLTLTDKMSMAHGLEVRVPFLDTDLVDFSSHINLRDKLAWFDTKVILKNAFRSNLPKYLFGQPKRGWFSPGAKWLRDPSMVSQLKHIFSPSFYQESNSMFDFGLIESILEDHRIGNAYHLDTLWKLLVFQIWAESYNVKL